MKIHFANMYSKRLGDSGIGHEDVDELKEVMEGVKNKFLQDQDKIDFVKLPHEYEVLQKALQKADEVAFGKSTVVVIGIGGSDLGARAVHKALGHQYHNEMVGKGIDRRKLYFAGDTTDPVALQELLEVIDLSSTLFVIVSKSGNTVEQASNFVFFRDQVRQNLGEESIKDHFLFITDPQSGTLHALVEKHGYHMVEHRPVGGRFSVLSSVGMVPAHLVGLDIKQFLNGAKDLAQKIEESSTEKDDALLYAILQFEYFNMGKNINVLMPYNYHLREFALWFRQLWAESLGKRVNNKGEVVNTGATPVAAMGPTDQHSQLQLYNEGPSDKTITFLLAGEPKANINLPENYTDIEEFEFLRGKNFYDILRKEMETTAFALTKYGRPNCLIEIDRLDEYNLGKLFYFFEMVTAYMGYLFDINAYDQPGVELSKKAMFGVLGKAGYDKEKTEFDEYLQI